MAMTMVMTMTMTLVAVAMAVVAVTVTMMAMTVMWCLAKARPPPRTNPKAEVFCDHAMLVVSSILEPSSWAVRRASMVRDGRGEGGGSRVCGGGGGGGWRCGGGVGVVVRVW